MPSNKSSRKGRPADEQPVTFALRLNDPAQLRLYAWLRTLPSKSGVFQHTAKQLLTQHLDAIGFHPSDADLRTILVERGLAEASRPPAPTPGSHAQPSLSTRPEDEDDEVSM